MRKLVVLVLAIMLGNSLYSQLVINKSLSLFKPVEIEIVDTMDVEYISITPRSNLFSFKKTCLVDYGQKREPFYRSSLLRNSDKIKLTFNSEVEILNYLEKLGWECMDFEYYSFVLRRKVDSKNYIHNKESVNFITEL